MTTTQAEALYRAIVRTGDTDHVGAAVARAFCESA
jgi:hypothetical protein